MGIRQGADLQDPRTAVAGTPEVLADHGESIGIGVESEGAHEEGKKRSAEIMKVGIYHFSLCRCLFCYFSFLLLCRQEFSVQEFRSLLCLNFFRNVTDIGP